MIKENGVGIHLGKAPRGFDWDNLAESAREERIKEASGL
jgi:hypothetical protein